MPLLVNISNHDGNDVEVQILIRFMGKGDNIFDEILNHLIGLETSAPNSELIRIYK